MHIEDSPVERNPDLVSKILALREQAEKQMNQFTNADDYDVRRVTGRKPKVDAPQVPSATSPKKRQVRKAEQASIDFAPAPAEPDTDNGEEA